MLSGKRLIAAGLLCLVAMSAYAQPHDTHHAPASAAKAEGAAEGESGGHGGHGGGGPLSFKTDLALWTLVVFVALMLVLWRYAWGPIAKGLESRERMIADQIAQAERSNEEARRLLADYEQKLSGSQEEVRGILERGRRDAEQAGRELIEQARSEAKREQEKVLREIEQAKDGAVKEIAEQGAQLAVDLAGKIVGARLQPADHEKLIEQALARFPERKGNFN